MAIINSVIAGGGTNPTGTKSITANGVYDVTDYASADVNVPTTAPAHYIEKGVNANGKLVGGTNVINLTGVTDIGQYVLSYAYYGASFPANTSADLSSLTKVSGQYGCQYMFYGCTGLTSVDLSSLTTVSAESGCGVMFRGCSSLTSVDLSSLTTVSANSGCGSMFYGCSGLTSVNLPALTKLNGSSACQQMFYGCSGLTSVNLPALTTVSGSYGCNNMFNGCTNLTSLSFPSITPNSFGGYVNQFGYMCGGISNITLHFPSNTQAKIETMQGYSTTAPFGATSGTVLFDLPATNTLTGADTVTYTRNPKYDTATALAWKVGAYGTTNFTPAYYTSGTSDPQANDTIYSDAACTTAVTTISTIA